MKAEIDKLYAEFADTTQTEKCLTIFTGKMVKPRFDAVTKPEIIIYQDRKFGPGYWSYSTAEDMSITSQWKPNSQYIHEAIIALFTAGIEPDRSVA